MLAQVERARRHRAADPPTSSAVDPEITSWPPCATAISRAHRFRVWLSYWLADHSALSGVHAHPSSQRPGVAPGLSRQRELGVDGRRNRVGGGTERSRHPIAAVGEHHTIVTADRILQESVVTGDRRCHRLPILFPEPCRALEIGEEERNRPGRKRRRHGPTRYVQTILVALGLLPIRGLRALGGSPFPGSATRFGGR